MNRRPSTAFAGAGLLLDRGIRDQLRLAWRLLRDERVSSLKLVLPAALAFYVVSPVDSIPDFLPGLGQIDDLGLVVAGVLLLARIMPRLAPGHVVAEHLRDMGKGYAPAKPGSDPQDIVEAQFNVRS